MKKEEKEVQEEKQKKITMEKTGEKNTRKKQEKITMEKILGRIWNWKTVGEDQIEPETIK